MPIAVPLLETVAIADLLPTQITVGYREVKEKRKSWRAQVDKDGAAFLGHHSIPVVLAPKDRLFMVDHHHLARALSDEGVQKVLVNPVADYHRVDKASFWTVLDLNKMCHPYNANGVRVGYDEIPSSVGKLEDDPFRSLSGELRRAGGFAKDITNFSEFIWADFLRRRFKKKEIVDDFDRVITAAMALAKSKEANYLPGWCGPQ